MIPKCKLISRFLMLALTLPLLAACATSPEAKIASIRSQKLPGINQQLVQKRLEPGAPVFARLFKDTYMLETFVRDEKSGDYKLFKTYDICGYAGEFGPKLKEGDQQAPEGFYNVTAERLWPGSKYHLSMNIGYPNEFDRANGRTGSKLMIHGGCYSDGCYAMGNPAIEEIYLLFEQSLRQSQDSIPVHIFPFKMTTENLAKYGADSDNLEFWQDLKVGYDLFELNRTPPEVAVEGKRYIFPQPVFL